MDQKEFTSERLKLQPETAKAVSNIFKKDLTANIGNLLNEFDKFNNLSTEKKRQFCIDVLNSKKVPEKVFDLIFEASKVIEVIGDPREQYSGESVMKIFDKNIELGLKRLATKLKEEG